jgi:flavin reductase (DIM6/NTAB) family NADH-FMN oxidoreductase RutF
VVLRSEPERQLAAALGKVPSGLFILTIRKEDAETGMLVSFVQQCSFEPPQLTLAIKQGRYLTEWLNAGVRFTLNVLDDTQTDMIGHFGRGFEPGAPAFEGLEVARRSDGAPILMESLAYLDCQIVSRHPGGDHDVFISRVLGGAVLSEGRPMIHVRKSGFHY